MTTDIAHKMYLCPVCGGWRGRCRRCDQQGTVEMLSTDLLEIVPAYPPVPHLGRLRQP
jgi:hypothetical protein